MDARMLWHVTMSVDGFIADRHDGIEWHFGHGKAGPIVDAVIQATGAVLAGRRGYNAGLEAGRASLGPYGGAWHGPIFVLTHRSPAAAADPQITFLSDGIDNAVATARAAAGPRSVGVFGASIARQCIEHRLLDEIVIHLVPVLVGDGIRFYDAPGAEPIRMERIPTPDAGQITNLHFRILK